MQAQHSEFSFHGNSVAVVLRALAGAACIILSTVCIPRISAAQTASIASTASYVCDFETGPCDLSEQSKIGDSFPSRASIITGISRSGSRALRLHTEPGDNNVHGSGTWERDDMVKPPDASYCNEGQDEWWAFSVLFPDDYSFPAPGQGGVIVDFHHNADGGLPNLGLEVRGESGMRISGYGGPTINGGQYRTQIADPWGATNNVTHNVWYDFVFHMKWSSGGDGVSDIWLNGKKVQSYSGATLYSGISCYLKLADYHDPTGQPSSTIFDRVLRGASAADVALGALEGVDGFFAPSTGTAPTGGNSGPGTSTSGTGSGVALSSATMDSSSYMISAGASVTFTARILGNSATPTGTVSFASDAGPIAGCSSMPMSLGAASCTTNALTGGQHVITGAYSGDVTYAPARAGPITQTVTGSSTTAANVPSLPASFSIDSSSYSINSGDAVTFTATIPGAGGYVGFTDNGGIIAACASVGVSASGSATCTTNALAAGSHLIAATYSGNGPYAAGVAGPITETVTDSITANVPSLPARFGMDSSRYSINAGDAVTFTATIPGAGGYVSFTNNGGIISACASVAVSASGSATCTTNALAAGSHLIAGIYSGNGSYAAGVAGPITQLVNM